jgi:site-specific DNA recombinase
MSHTYTQKSANKLYRYYVCVTAHQKGYGECPTRSVSAPAIEQAVVDQIRGISRNPVVVNAVFRELEDGRTANIESLQRERRLLEKELGRISDEIAGVVPLGGKLTTERLAELQERATAHERRLRDLRGQLAATAGSTIDAAAVRQTMEHFDGLWTEMSPREQERFVKTLVEGVLYNGETAEVTVGFRTKAIRNLCMEGTIQ